jgi:formylglycine-generating enzyme required for sulfatase activity
MKKTLCLAAALGAAGALAVPPLVSNVTLEQPQGSPRSAVVTYETSGPGIATFLLKTGGVDVCHSEIVRTVSGDISRYVGAGTHRFTWDAGRDFPEHLMSNLTATVTLWATNNPPTYCAVSLVETGRTLFYGSADEVPFGANHSLWKKNWLLLRKIPATEGPRGVAIGSLNTEWNHQADETLRVVRITRPFYMGVFNVTQRQWDLVGTRANPSGWNNTEDWEERPVEKVTYYYARENAAANASDPNIDWPTTGHAVRADSFMGRLRAKTGGILEFDLPTEAQWEYACRAGTTGPWNNGLGSVNNGLDPNLALLGRYAYNGGLIQKGATWYDPSDTNAIGSVGAVTASNATAKVGSYLPNAWGLYDMHGNVFDWCLDTYTGDASDATLSGDDPAGPVVSGRRVMRGGSWSFGAEWSRSARRASGAANQANYSYNGLRVVAPAEVLVQ